MGGIKQDTIPLTKSIPYWLDSTGSTNYPALTRDEKVDTIIVGGGIVGISIGYLLKKEGLKVGILERERILKGTTGHTTAKITSQHGLKYDTIKKQLGEERGRQYAQANEKAIRWIEQMIQEKKIDCDYSRQKAYVYTQSEKYVQRIEEETKAAEGFGLKAYYKSELPLPFEVKASVCFDDQAQFHPRKYLLALAQDIPGEGSHIFEHTRVETFFPDREKVIVTANGYTMEGDYLVIASHYPVYESFGFYYTRLLPQRSHVLALKIAEKFPGGMYINVEKPTRSLRFTPNGNDDLIMIGGEGHVTGEGPGDNPYENLLYFARKLFHVQKTFYHWSAQDYRTLDQIPYIGRINSKNKNVYVATGFGKWGMSNGTAAALIIKDLLLKGDSPHRDVFDPGRFKINPMIKTWLSNAIRVGAHYAGKVRPASKDRELSPGEARIVTCRGRKYGLYRDEKGTVHGVNNVCTHMGCNLHWNPGELSWDCPCHGSRFTYEGNRIEGPAMESITRDQEDFNS